MTSRVIPYAAKLNALLGAGFARTIKIANLMTWSVTKNIKWIKEQITRGETFRVIGNVKGNSSKFFKAELIELKKAVASGKYSRKLLGTTMIYGVRTRIYEYAPILKRI